MISRYVFFRGTGKAASNLAYSSTVKWTFPASKFCSTCSAFPLLGMAITSITQFYLLFIHDFHSLHFVFLFLTVCFYYLMIWVSKVNFATHWCNRIAPLLCNSRNPRTPHIIGKIPLFANVIRDIFLCLFILFIISYTFFFFFNHDTLDLS